MQKVKINKTREQIIEVAKHFFQKFGFDKTSMNDIANAAHKAKRSLYNHFNDKENLFCSVVIEEVNQIYQKLYPILENKEYPPLLRFREYLLARFELVAASGIWHIVIEQATNPTTSSRFEKLSETISHFEQWEHNAFVALWEQDSNDKGDFLKKTPFNANAFANMTQMLLKSLDHSFFVHNKYMEYKETYTFLVNLIINNLNININKEELS